MTERKDHASEEEPRGVAPDGGYDYTADEDETLSEAVVMAVATVRDADPTDLSPLYDTIDPDGLDELFGPSVRSDPEPRLEFVYEGCDVTVFPSGRVVVEELD